MQTQLAQRYLADNLECQHGLYLVGWFMCEDWIDTDYRKKKTKSWGLNLITAGEYFKSQAAELSNDRILIKAFVINAALTHTKSDIQN